MIRCLTIPIVRCIFQYSADSTEKAIAPLRNDAAEPCAAAYKKNRRSTGTAAVKDHETAEKTPSVPVTAGPVRYDPPPETLQSNSSDLRSGNADVSVNAPATVSYLLMRRSAQWPAFTAREIPVSDRSLAYSTGRAGPGYPIPFNPRPVRLSADFAVARKLCCSIFICFCLLMRINACSETTCKGGT